MDASLEKMKKYALVFLVMGVVATSFLFAFSVQAAPSLQITSPSGGETFPPGGTIRVTWTSSDVEKVSVSLLKKGGASYHQGSYISNSSSYDIPF